MNIPESFRFLTHARLRRDERLRVEREHQLALLTQVTKTLEVLVDGQARQAEEHGKALFALAASVTAQAESFNSWIKSFQIVSAPTTSVVTEEDEYRDEQRKMLGELGLSPESVGDLPPEFRLAFDLQRDFTEAVRADSKP